MPDSRTVEDKLREEYFELLPEIRRTLLETETRVRRELLDVSLRLQRYERLIVTSRIKDAIAPWTRCGDDNRSETSMMNMTMSTH